MKFDLVISGGTIVTADGTRQEDLGIREGLIAGIGEDLIGEEMVAAEGCYLLPGAVDPHVHLNMPAGQTRSSDTWETGTIAAVCGGTTTVIDFVEPEDGQSLLEAWQRRREEAEAGSRIDFGLHMTVTNDRPETLKEISRVVEAGCASFKLYTTYEGFLLRDEQLLRVMRAVREAGGMVLVHSENDAMVAYATRQTAAAGVLGPAGHPLSRPPESEGEAVERVLCLAGLAGVPVYIVHISTAYGAAALQRALDRGVTAWGETCPQYLLLDEQAYRQPDFEGAKFVCSPPLRSKDHQAALWTYLQQGALHSVGTDHCPFFFQGQKDLGRDDFRSIPGGLPGIQARLALIYTAGAAQGRLSLEDWVSLCCTGPAKIFGLYPRKGSLELGADADVVIFDPDHKQKISREMLTENVDYTPYEGVELAGSVRSVYVGGRLLAEQGRWLSEPGRGSFLPRKLAWRNYAHPS